MIKIGRFLIRRYIFQRLLYIPYILLSHRFDRWEPITLNIRKLGFVAGDFEFETFSLAYSRINENLWVCEAGLVGKRSYQFHPHSPLNLSVLSIDVWFGMLRLLFLRRGRDPIVRLRSVRGGGWDPVDIGWMWVGENFSGPGRGFSGDDVQWRTSHHHLANEQAAV